MGCFLPFISSASNCSQIRILDRNNADEVHYTLDDLIAPAGRTQRTVVREAFKLAPELTCLAVQRVVFIHDAANRGVAGRNKANDRQDLIYLNAAADRFNESTLARSEPARMYAMQTVLHEATHAAARLLYYRSKEGPPAWLEWAPFQLRGELWGPQAISTADKAIATARLEKGLFQEWGRLHRSFLRAGLVHDYYGGGWTGILGESPGFASPYGGEDITEDIAEIAGWALIGQKFDSVVDSGTYPEENRACLAMRQEPGPGIPAKLAAVFAKVGFAHSLGLITDEAYEYCVGNLKIRGEGSGFFTFEDGRQVKRYTGDVRGKMGSMGDSGSYLFELEAGGSIGLENKGERPARMRLTLEVSRSTNDIDLVSFPRGLYHIGAGHSAFNTLQISYQNEGDTKMALEIAEADILIGRGSRELVEGTLFIKKFYNYTELFKRLAQAPKKPRIITFRKDNR